MKRKIVWLVVTGWLVAALLLASCAPAIVKEEAEKVAPSVEKKEVVMPKEVVVPKEETNLVKWTGKKMDGTVVEKMIEKPRYGGVHIRVSEVQPVTFDNFGVQTVLELGPTNEELLTTDQIKGPVGTGEFTGYYNAFFPLMERGELAESWELPDETTIVWHIRQGVHWALDPASEASRLVGGREFTAADVVASLRYRFGTGGYGRTRAPYLADMKNVANSIYLSPTDKWAVVMKVQPGGAGLVWETSGDANIIHPPEVNEKYGDMTNWKNVVGTGPFSLKEYVGASSLTYVRNPNYWQRDPFFPENQLPYLDSVKVLIILDASTRLAAMRTGKVDNLSVLEAEDAEPLMKSNPELKVATVVGTDPPTINMRNDTKPFDDIRVRRALWLAINKQELRDVYYGGKATLFAYPISTLPEVIDMYTPLEQMPESVQELYSYNPDKAKQLLAEAGYPQGFKAEVLAWDPAEVDLLQIVKEYWAKIGVDLKIDVKDRTIFISMLNRKTYTQMIMYPVKSTSLFTVRYERAGQQYNLSMINDPRLEAALKAMDAAYFDEPKRRQIMKDLVPYWQEQAWYITLPIPHRYFLWQPWLKNYYSTSQTGYLDGLDYARYVWLDQDLKKAMGR